MNGETTLNITVYARNMEVDNSKKRKALFVNSRTLYVTDMRYLEECSGSECCSHIVQK